MSSPRERHGTARATVEGDPGVENPGLDSEHLLVRGEGVQGDDVRSTFANAGLSEKEIDEVLLDHPQLTTAYDLVHEIQPRINYMRFLVDNDRFEGETVSACVMRQPQILERKFSLVHECADYAAVNKPWCVRLDTPRGWPGKIRFTGKYPGDLSVEDWLERKYVDTKQWDRVRFCHQLDNATSGVLLSAANKKAAAAAAKLFRERKARKTYLALVFGHPSDDEWTCEVDLGRDPNDPKGFKERVVESIEEGERAAQMLQGKASTKARGKACETRFRVLERGTLTLRGKYFGRECAKILVAPVTGRRHQIRVHLAHCGHPIVGDNAYSEDTDSFRTFLHAHVLEMPFPEPKGTMRFEAPEPESFAAAMTTTNETTE
jgi:23S rRNA-/tRNA-specific pseudouridylate synthase